MQAISSCSIIWCVQESQLKGWDPWQVLQHDMWALKPWSKTIIASICMSTTGAREYRKQNVCKHWKFKWSTFQYSHRFLQKLLAQISKRIMLLQHRNTKESNGQAYEQVILPSLSWLLQTINISSVKKNWGEKKKLCHSFSCFQFSGSIHIANTSWTEHDYWLKMPYGP